MHTHFAHSLQKKKKFGGRRARPPLDGRIECETEDTRLNRRKKNSKVMGFEQIHFSPGKNPSNCQNRYSTRNKKKTRKNHNTLLTIYIMHTKKKSPKTKTFKTHSDQFFPLVRSSNSEAQCI